MKWGEKIRLEVMKIMKEMGKRRNMNGEELERYDITLVVGGDGG